MNWIALVAPRKNTVDYPGMCLRFAQSFFGAPVRHKSAWIAWQNQQFRHGPHEPLPSVPVLLWFSHYGTYGSPPEYANWGHVAVYVPGDAIYSSPANPYAGAAQDRYATIQQIERNYNAQYVGWSEDINGLRVAQPTANPVIPLPVPIPEEDEEMNTYFEASVNSSPLKPGDLGTSRIWAGDGRVIDGAKYSGVWERSYDGSIRRLFQGEWEGIKAAYAAAGRKLPLAKVHGNVIEQMYLVTRSAPKR